MAISKGHSPRPRAMESIKQSAAKASVSNKPPEVHEVSPLTFYANLTEVGISNYEITLVFAEANGGGTTGRDQVIRVRVVLPHFVAAQLGGSLMMATQTLEKLYHGRIPFLGINEQADLENAMNEVKEEAAVQIHAMMGAEKNKELAPEESSASSDNAAM